MIETHNDYENDAIYTEPTVRYDEDAKGKCKRMRLKTGKSLSKTKGGWMKWRK